MNKTHSINTTTDTLNFDDIPKIYDNIDKIKIIKSKVKRSKSLQSI
jgi:hypothetical protein